MLKVVYLLGFFLFFICFLTNSQIITVVQGQGTFSTNIFSINYSPANPLTTDSITIDYKNIIPNYCFTLNIIDVTDPKIPKNISPTAKVMVQKCATSENNNAYYSSVVTSNIGSVTISPQELPSGKYKLSATQYKQECTFGVCRWTKVGQTSDIYLEIKSPPSEVDFSFSIQDPKQILRQDIAKNSFVATAKVVKKIGGEPVPNIEISLKNINGTVVDKQTTGNLGATSFSLYVKDLLGASNISVGTYTIRAIANINGNDIEKVDYLYVVDQITVSTLTPTGPAGTTSTVTSTPGPKGTGTGTHCYTANGLADPNGNGLLTALGCIPTDFNGIVESISKLAIGMGGGIALLLMISGSFRMIASAGNPDAVKAGHEQFTSAIIGLLFIIFAVLLLKVIGVDILNIPGFV